MFTPLNSKKIESIQVLRGIAALFVVLYHYRNIINSTYSQGNLGDLLFNYGWIGVDLFFFISGFIIYKTTNKKTTAKEFAIKRVFRIFPVYWVCLIMFLLASWWTTSKGINFYSLFKSIVLIPNDYRSQGPFYGYSLLSVAWTLSYEVFFYFIFLLSMVISRKYRFELSSMMIILILAVTQNIFYENISFFDVKSNDNNMNISLISNFKFISNPMMLEFILGMFIAKHYDLLTRLSKEIPYVKFMLSFILIACILSIYSGFYNSHGISIRGIGIPALVIFIVTLLAESSHSFKPPKILVNLGTISYSLYLTHLLSPCIISIIFGGAMSTSGFNYLFTCLLTSIILSICMYVLIEKPTIHISRKYFTANSAS
ncbi:acyltransferase family protein [Morganella morganii]